MDDFGRKLSSFSHDRLALLCVELKARLDRMESARREPIAIVGMACRFPGGVTDPDSYWELLRNGVDAITEVPPERWDVDAFYDPDPEAPGKTYSRVAGHLDDVAGFDSFFFNISPREAVSFDPQYRLLLEVTWEALENAGINPQDLRGSATGVIVGIGADDYAKIQVRSADAESITAYTGTGNAYCYGAGRLSYFFGLHGPNFPVDTACSSSLVATHVGCRSLRARECDLAIVGGVHLILSPIGGIFLSKARALSPTGRCKTFDARADGFTRGEGCGMIVLKRLSDALADGDRIHAVIRGSAINHDGASSGFTVPNGMAQQAVIQAALKDAGIGPLDVGFVEAHGTGTSLGDPIEVRALAAVLGRSAGRPAQRPLALGAVKANFGHLEPASGVAGLMKAVLAVQRGEIPPQVHLQAVNPEIALDDGPFLIPTRPTPWPAGDGPRIAGVSSFGLSGTNSHVIVEEPPRLEERAAAVDRPLHVLTLSARTDSALRTLAARYERHLASGTGQSLADICFTANTGRAQFAHRLAVVGGSSGALSGELRAFARAASEPSRVLAGKVESGVRQRIAFLFTGEGQEKAGMARELHAAEPVFRDAIAACDAALEPDLEHPLAAVLYARETDGELLGHPMYGHAALFAVEYALLQLWRSWGIEPSAVLGHGVGEYVAATAAGVLGLEDALRLVIARARVARTLVPPGWRRAALTAKRGDVRPALAALPRDAVVLAVNSPRHAVVAAPEPALHAMDEGLTAQGIRVRLGASGPVPSEEDGSALERLRAQAAGVTYRAPQVPMVSATTGDWLGDDTDWASHWVAHASQPVRFSAAVEALHRRHRHFLEIGPAPVLSSWGSQSVASPEARWWPSLDGEDDWASVLRSLAALHVAGFPVLWAAVDRPCGRRKVTLPTYPFERERHWIELSSAREAPTLVMESDVLSDAASRSTIDRLLRAWGDDGSQAINRMVTAPLVFWPSSRQGFFYANQKGASMVAVSYVGPPHSFDSAARELMAYARDRGMNLVMIAREAYADRLRKLGFARSCIGVWQCLTDLDAFRLDAPAMRRLRSKVNAYARHGDCRTAEYRVGSDPATDRRFLELMEQWVARKKKKATFVSLLRDLVLTGRLPSGHRVFLTRRGPQTIDSVILLSPITSRNGYLLDLEFYAADMPQGCLEFSIVNAMALLTAEGCAYFSLGATYGTQLDPDPHEDPRIRELLQTFHREGILNEDGNFEFKKKFQPETTRIYVCTMPDADLSSLPDTLLMLAAPDAPARPAEAGSASALANRPPAQVPSLLQPPTSQRPSASAPVHPLLGQRLALAAPTVVFQSTIEPAGAGIPWLADHRVLDAVVMPAAAYIEMVFAAASTLFPGETTAVESLSLAEALTVDERQPRTVQLTFQHEEGKGGALSIWSNARPTASGDGDWTLHVSGRVARGAGAQRQAPQVAASLADVRSRGLRPTEVAGYYEQVARFGFRYGPSFHVIEALWSGYGEALARIRLPAALVSDARSYHMHPVLLDGCLQVQGASLLASRTGREEPAMYVPVGIERIELVQRPGTELWVHSRIRPAADGSIERIVGDLEVWDAQGERVAGLEGLAVGRTSAAVLQQLFAVQERHEEVFCRLEWRAAARRRDAQPVGAAAGLGWMVFADAGGTGARLAALVRARGERCVLVRPGQVFDVSDADCWMLDAAQPDHVRRALEHMPQLGRVVFAWPAEFPLPDTLDTGSLGAGLRTGCGGLLHIVQAMARAELGDAVPQLWVVSRAAHPVAGDPARVNPVQASVWALGRTIAQEHPRLWGGMIDLEADAAPSEAERLLEEISDSQDEDHIAYAGAQRYVGRLVATAEAAVPTSELRLREDATYLITGGAGGLGRTVARWMIGRGARHLLLAGRAPATEEIRRLLSELEDAGAHSAAYESTDVSREQDVARVLERIGRTMPPLRGLVHTAGVLADATLMEMSWSDFLPVLAPKVDGSWHLHRLTAGMPLDHFVLFSSSAAMLGAAGQGNYAAANGFLGALAQFRHARGLPAVSIDWGPWAQVGMAAALDPRVQALRASRGLHAFSPHQALRLLERAMLAGRPQVGVLAVDWEAMLASAAPLLRRSSLFKELVAAPTVAAAPQPAAASNPVLERLAQAEPGQRRTLVHAYVVEQVTRILGAESRELDPNESLTLQGFDSLMALELRDVVEVELQVTMPILTFFRSNSIHALASYVLGELDKRFAGAPAAPEPSPEEMLARLDELSEAELDLTLRRELAR